MEESDMEKMHLYLFANCPKFAVTYFYGQKIPKASKIFG
jgi:hypothetical protein